MQNLSSNSYDALRPASVLLFVPTVGLLFLLQERQQLRQEFYQPKQNMMNELIIAIIELLENAWFSFVFLT